MYALPIFLWFLSVMLVACYKICIYCLPLIWGFWVHYICLLLPSCMLVVWLWICLVGSCISCSFWLWQQPWSLLSLLLLQPLPVLLLHLHLAAHLPFFCVCILSVCICLFETFSWHHVVFLALWKITLVDADVHIYCYDVDLCLCL